MVARDFFTKERRGSENSGGGVMRVIFCADYAKRIDTEGGGGRQLHFYFLAKIFHRTRSNFPNMFTLKSLDWMTADRCDHRQKTEDWNAPMQWRFMIAFWASQRGMGLCRVAIASDSRGGRSAHARPAGPEQAGSLSSPLSSPLTDNR